MTANIARKTKWTLEELAFEFDGFEFNRPLSKAEFVKIADHNPNLQMEREPNGTVTLMSPVKKGSSRRGTELLGLMYNWNSKMGHGEVFGPNGTFDLPNGATKMPDVSWISPEKLQNEPEDEESYIQTVPDFVAEIRSSTDRLSKLQNKMATSWMANGVRLGWLIDAYDEQVFIYRQGELLPEIIKGFSQKSLSGENVMPGFELPLEKMKRR